MLIYLGYQPSSTFCSKCNKSVLEGYYSYDNGQFECNKCVFNKKYPINKDTIQISINLKFIKSKSKPYRVPSLSIDCKKISPAPKSCTFLI